jgi:hypothetical protein
VNCIQVVAHSLPNEETVLMSVDKLGCCHGGSTSRVRESVQHDMHDIPSHGLSCVNVAAKSVLGAENKQTHAYLPAFGSFTETSFFPIAIPILESFSEYLDTQRALLRNMFFPRSWHPKYLPASHLREETEKADM